MQTQRRFDVQNRISARKSLLQTTSAEAFERYVGGKCLAVGLGEAWRDIKAWIVALLSIVDTLHLPSVSEPFLAWTVDWMEKVQRRTISGRVTE
jgi:hypothetical protein